MIDSIHEPVARPVDHTSDRPAGKAAWQGDHLGRSFGRLRIADALLACGILVTLLVAANLGRMPQGFNGFLAIRLSLKNAVLLTAFGIAWPTILLICGVYADDCLLHGREEWQRLLLGGMLGGMVAMVFPLTSRSGAVRPIQVVLFVIAVVPATLLLHHAVRAAKRAHRQTRQRQVIIVGSGPIALRMHGALHADPLQSCKIIGFVDSDPQLAFATVGESHLGGIGELEQILMHRVVDDVLIGLPIKSRYEEIQQALIACERVGVPAQYSANPFDGGRAAVAETQHAHALLHSSRDYQLAIKRMMDIVGSAGLLIVLSPLMVVIAITIKMTSHGRVLFAQERYGYMKRRFRMYKFRTMVMDAESLQAELEHRNEATGPAFKIREDPRLTSIGRFLRRTSLDELPQLANVVVGQMSLVGPRPMAVRDVGLFAEPWLMKRFSVRPGLTCLWQISGRSDLAFDQWIALDLKYIDTWSLSQDLMILIKTVPAVVLGAGAS